MSDSELDCTPPEVLQAAKASIEKLLPSKSSGVYEMSYQRFLKWCLEKKVSVYSENVLLAYFSELAKNMKSSSLWSHYSMIKAMLNLKKNVDITKYLKLRAFIKKQGEGYQPKKAKVLTKEQFDKFMFDAPDEKYLGTKIVLLFGVSGACRCHELSKMKINDIEDLGSLLLIKVPETKTGKPRSFSIVGEEFIIKYRQYVNLRPADFEEQRFFLKYQNGRCYRMVMGIHKLGNVAKEVASYLNLPDSKEYTGHSLRRTSATLLVDKGGDLTTLKRHGGWRSSSVAEGYIEESVNNKKDIANKILQPNNPIQSNSAPSTSGSAIANLNLANNINNHLGEVRASGLFQNPTLNNCTFTINVNK